MELQQEGCSASTLCYSLAVAREARQAARKLKKRVDNKTYLAGRQGAVLKEEVWFDKDKLVKYSLAYVNPQLSSVDNGRVLGYDNSHNYHHRHFKGTVGPFDFTSYEALVERFEQEVRELWRKEDEEKY
ncbi:MAG: DUF6516 family protein [Acidobacteriaceae bacterium]